MEKIATKTQGHKDFTK